MGDGADLAIEQIGLGKAAVGVDPDLVVAARIGGGAIDGQGEMVIAIDQQGELADILITAFVGEIELLGARDPARRLQAIAVEDPRATGVEIEDVEVPLEPVTTQGGAESRIKPESVFEDGPTQLGAKAADV